MSLQQGRQIIYVCRFLTELVFWYILKSLVWKFGTLYSMVNWYGLAILVYMFHGYLVFLWPCWYNTYITFGFVVPIRDQCYDFLNIFGKKISEKFPFFTQNKAKLWKIIYHNMGLWEKRQFFRRKLAKIEKIRS
jgi:hypothetical protein